VYIYVCVCVCVYTATYTYIVYTDIAPTAPLTLFYAGFVSGVAVHNIYIYVCVG